MSTQNEHNIEHAKKAVEQSDCTNLETDHNAPHIVRFRSFDFVRSISFVRFRSFDFVRSISFVRFRSFDFVSSISFVRFRSFVFVRSISFVRFRSFDFVRSISFVRFRLFDFVRSISFVRFHSFDFVRSNSFVTPGCNVLLPHFSRRVRYRWLYSLWKSVNVMNDITTFIFAELLMLFARWQQTTTAHLSTASLD